MTESQPECPVNGLEIGMALFTAKCAKNANRRTRYFFAFFATSAVGPSFRRKSDQKKQAIPVNVKGPWEHG